MNPICKLKTKTFNMSLDIDPQEVRLSHPSGYDPFYIYLYLPFPFCPHYSLIYYGHWRLERTLIFFLHSLHYFGAYVNGLQRAGFDFVFFPSILFSFHVHGNRLLKSDIVRGGSTVFCFLLLQFADMA